MSFSQSLHLSLFILSILPETFSISAWASLSGFCSYASFLPQTSRLWNLTKHSPSHDSARLISVINRQASNIGSSHKVCKSAHTPRTHRFLTPTHSYRLEIRVGLCKGVCVCVLPTCTVIVYNCLRFISINVLISATSVISDQTLWSGSETLLQSARVSFLTYGHWETNTWGFSCYSKSKF